MYVAPLSPERIDGLLRRIGYEGPRAPEPSTLRALQRAHMMAVPFENLDISLGRRIELDLDRFYDKVVGERRGGYCFELNGLFGALLAGLGFAVGMRSARVAMPDGTFTPSFDHMALEVTLDEAWLVDVGFGDAFLEPLRLREAGPQDQDGRRFRIAPDGDGSLVTEEKDDDAEPLYLLEPGLHALEAYAGRNHWLQTDENSPFVRRRLCSLAIPGGRITISGDRLIVTERGERTETELGSEAEIRRLLDERFGVRL